MSINQFQFVDERVSKIKFDKQVKNYKNLEAEYRRGGIISLKIEYPYLEFLFFSSRSLEQFNLTSNGKKQVLNLIKSVPKYLFAIRVDYSNYDTLPPSIQFINPFNSMVTKDLNFLPCIFPDQQNMSSIVDEKFKTQPQSLAITNNKDNLFICLRGIREYHEHPQHDGDSWFLSRLEGKGEIISILDQLQLYSIANYDKQIRIITEHLKRNNPNS